MSYEAVARLRVACSQNTAALQDQRPAVARYRQALALFGSSATTPELYAAAGARFTLDVSTMRELIQMVEQRITAL